MRRFDFNGSPKTIAASTTVTLTPSDIPSDGIVAYHLFPWATDGGGNDFFDCVDRVRLKANGITRWDVSGAILNQFREKTTPKQPLQATGDDQCFTIPLYNLMLDDEDEADAYQTEPGTNISIEVVFNGTAEAGSLYCGWTQTNIAPKFYTKLYAQQMNIANGALNARFNLSEGGRIMGFGIPSLGLTRLKLVLNGEQWFHMLGSDYAAAASQGLIFETQRYRSMLATPTATLPINYFHIFNTRAERGVPATPGNSYVELDANGASAWAGTANEWTTYAAVPV